MEEYQNIDMFKAYNDFLDRVFNRIRELQPTTRLDQRDLLSMLDLALATGDRGWFLQITERLHCLKAFGGETIEL